MELTQSGQPWKFASILCQSTSDNLGNLHLFSANPPILCENLQKRDSGPTSCLAVQPTFAKVASVDSVLSYKDLPRAINDTCSSMLVFDVVFVLQEKARTTND